MDLKAKLDTAFFGSARVGESSTFHVCACLFGGKFKIYIPLGLARINELSLHYIIIIFASLPIAIMKIEIVSDTA